MSVLSKIPIVIVYKKSKRANAKPYLEVFHDTVVDDLINLRKKKPIIPDNYEIIEMGMGESFIAKYKKKYKING